MARIKSHEELDVYRLAFEAAMGIFRASKAFPKSKTYSLTDQIRRSSRSVCASIAEASRKRRYPSDFLLRLSNAEAEAAETQTWIAFARTSNYLDEEKATELRSTYDQVIGKLVRMINNPDPWILKSR